MTEINARLEVLCAQRNQALDQADLKNHHLKR